jgi:F-type H+-transporting ATPase subunit a
VAKKRLLGCSFPVAIIIGVAVLLLFVASLLTGPLGGNALKLPQWMLVSKPVPELPATVIFHLFGFPITNSIVATWITILVLGVFSWAVTRKIQLVPGRKQALLEFAIESLLNFCRSVAGEKNGRRFFPLVATIFLFVSLNAWLSLLPGYGSILVHFSDGSESIGTTIGAKNNVISILSILPDSPAAKAGIIAGDSILAIDGISTSGMSVADAVNDIKGQKGTPVKLMVQHAGETTTSELTIDRAGTDLLRGANTDINTSLAVAIVSFIFVEIIGFRTLGIGYGKKFLNLDGIIESGKLLVKGKIKSALSKFVFGFINLFVGIIEFVSELIRIVSLTIRLFGNMTAGEILLLVAVFLMPWLFALPFYGLELLVGFVQALIFASLTLIFLTTAVASHGDHKEDTAHH